MTTDLDVKVAPADVKTLESFLQSPSSHAVEIARIMAKTLGIKADVGHATVTTEHSPAKGSPVLSAAVGVTSWKCCAQYTNGTCGCTVYPPGICRMCTANERRTT
jgi:hypothetical protein